MLHYCVSSINLILCKMNIDTQEQQTTFCSSSSPKTEESSKKGLKERENILTIPNFLCLSRILMSPYIAHLIVQTGNYPWALAAFGYAGITDLVSVQNSLYWKLSVNCLFYLNSWTDGLLVTSRDKCQSLGVSWTLCRTRC